MILDEMPYFMENEKWFKYAENETGIDLTEEGKKDPKVVKSYVDYMALFGIYVDGNYNRIKED